MSMKKIDELTELEQEFEEDLPDILGGVFDVLESDAHLPDVHLRKLPRMADFFAVGGMQSVKH